ncbi:hypothetical protein [Pseudomonas sp. SBB6]|uniref:hypothetical protein n=1 Tax=Pseudomonas sp. SBB6 TaxID=2962032 RepID=UPI0020B77176|nr:hypothetical protein [Pseudomonas sp. SBB6]MCP3750880.1 hypothetical protein [Pseudomonas sp. SBB6]
MPKAEFCTIHTRRDAYFASLPFSGGVMAILHYCYVFDTTTLSTFANETPEQIVAHLHADAVAAVAKQTPALTEALTALRFSPSWINGDREEADVAAKQWVICLLAHSRQVPSLGREAEPPYHLILKLLLEDAGWSNDSITLLLHGEPLGTLLTFAGRDDLKPLFSGLEDRGGWLSHAQASTLLAQLEASRGYLLNEHARHAQILHDVTIGQAQRIPALTLAAWSRALEMLNSLTSPRESLFLLLD